MRGLMKLKTLIFISAKIIDGDLGVIQNYLNSNYKITLHGDSMMIKYVTPQNLKQTNYMFEDLEDDLEIPL